MDRKSNFNSYELTKRLNELDKQRESRQPYKSMGIHKATIEDIIVNKIYRYGMIGGVRL